MHSHRTTFDSRRLLPALLGAALLGGLAWIAWPTLHEMVQTWDANPQYSHGYLVVPLALALLWHRRGRMHFDAWRPYFPGVGLLVVGLVLHAVAVQYYVGPLAAYALLPSIAGLVLLLAGPAALRWAWPAIGYLFFMMPLPYQAESFLAYPLRRLGAEAGAYVLQALQLPAAVDGTTLFVGAHELEVAVACNGLGMLLSFFALATALLLFVERPWFDRAVILLSAAPVALLANLFRIVLTALLYQFHFGSAAQKVFHDWAGFCMMPTALVLLGTELKLLGLRSATMYGDVRSLCVRGPSWSRRSRPLRLAGIGVLIAVVAAGAGSYGLRGRTAARLAQEWLVEGQANDDAGQFAAAADCYRRVLACEPANQQARALLDLARLRLGNTAEPGAAVKILESVVEREPHRAEVRLALAQALVAKKEFARAVPHLDALESEARYRTQAAQLKAACLEAQGQDLRQVAAGLEKALAAAPGDVALATQLAAVWARLNEPQKADEVMEQAVGRNGGSFAAYLARARHHAKQGRRDEAAEDIDRAMQLAPAEPAVLLAATQVPQPDEQLEALRTKLQQEIAAKPQETRLYTALARAELQAGRAAEAVAVLRQGVAAMPRRLDLVPALADLLISQGNTTEAVALVERMRAEEYAPAMQEYLNARLAMSRRQWPEAGDALQRLRQQPGLSAELRRAITRSLTRALVAAAIQEKDADRALLLARQSVAADSTDYGDYLWQGHALWALNKADEAEPALRRAVAVAPNQPIPRIALIEFLVAVGRKAGAQAAVEDVRANFTHEDKPLVLAMAAGAFGQWEEAEVQYKAALEVRPADSRCRRNLVDFYLRRGQFAKAETLLREVLTAPFQATREDQVWARRLLAVNVGLQPQKLTEALELLDLNLAALPDSAEDLRLKAGLLARRAAGRAAAIDILDGLNQRKLLTPAEQLQLARLQMLQGNWTQARERLKDLIARPGVPAAAVVLYARELIQRGEMNEARPAVDRLAQAAPRSWPVIELQARILHADGESARAATLVEDFARGHSENAIAAGTLLESLKLTDAAEAVYRNLARRAPENVLTLAEFLARRGRVAEALDLCEQAWDRFPADKVAVASMNVVRGGNADVSACRRVEARLVAALRREPKMAVLTLSLANVRELAGDYAGAESLYRAALKDDANNIWALNNLAWLLAARAGDGDRTQAAEALSLVRRAIDRSGPLPALLDTRGLIYLKMGMLPQAKDDLEAAVADGPTAARYFHLARVQFLARDAAAARRSLEQARALGLKADDLYPLERPEFATLTAALAKG